MVKPSLPILFRRSFRRLFDFFQELPFFWDLTRCSTIISLLTSSTRTGVCVLDRASHFVQLFSFQGQHSCWSVGQERLELSTPRLSSVCSNQLSYWPVEIGLSRPNSKPRTSDGLSTRTEQLALCWAGIDRNRSDTRSEQDSRKEVIQPQVPLRLPCYDFTPVTIHSLGGCLTRLAHRLLEQMTPMV